MSAEQRSTYPSLVFDEVEFLDGASPRRWPLHPIPMPHERLSAYVRRLAFVYDTSFRAFCGFGLGCEPWEVGAFDYCPPGWALERLSEGTGLSIERLRGMIGLRRYAVLIAQVHRLGAPRHVPDHLRGSLQESDAQDAITKRRRPRAAVRQTAV